MSRGFNMWNYMTYHLVHDYFKAKKKKKTEIQNFEVKNYKAAQKAAEQWIKSVRKFAESSYGVHYPKELYYGATQVSVDNRPFHISIFLHRAQYFPHLRTFPLHKSMHLHILS